MSHDDSPPPSHTAGGMLLVPIHSVNDGTALRVCVVMTEEPSSDGESFVVLRELPGARVYLGALCDAQARLQEWLEIWVQTIELRELAFSSYQERLTNHLFDQRWRSEYEMSKSHLPEAILVTGMEEKNPNPILVKRRTNRTPAGFALAAST